MFNSYCIFHIIYSILKFEIHPFFSPDYPVCAICETANNEQVVKLGEKGCQLVALLLLCSYGHLRACAL